MGWLAAFWAATTSTASTGPPKLTLIDQPPWVAGRQVLQLRLRIQPAGTSGLAVRVSLHAAMRTRLGFEQTIADEGLGRVIDSAAVAVDTAPKGPQGTFYARFGMPGAKTPAGTRLQVPETGVYPLTVELRSGTVAIDHFVTWLVYVANGQKGNSAIPEPLSVSWVWSVIAPLAYQPGTTTPDPAVLAQFAKTGRLGQIVAPSEPRTRRAAHACGFTRDVAELAQPVARTSRFRTLGQLGTHRGFE